MNKKIIFGLLALSLILISGCSETDVSKEDRIDKLEKDLSDIQYKVWVLEQQRQMLKDDLETLKSDKEYKYVKVPDSNYVARLEYDPKFYSQIDISERDKKIELNAETYDEQQLKSKLCIASVSGDIQYPENCINTEDLIK